MLAILTEPLLKYLGNLRAINTLPDLKVSCANKMIFPMLSSLFTIRVDGVGLSASSKTTRSERGY